MPLPRFDYGEAVRVIRNVRNDGTFPGMDTGTLLIRRGSVGYVTDVGTFLQDQLIYSVNFLEAGRMVGCREEELILASEPWVPNLYEFKDMVATTRNLALRGEVLVQQGQTGQVLRVVRDLPEGMGMQYHVHFGDGLVLQVPEQSLQLVASQAGTIEATEDEAEHD
ncbi:nitrogen fixation protein NifZ [Azomonas agilis]|uniref:Nitrogen fixation protein NifZ n=1 Tax=Azomonas agilis TaxID=116849 RepID=A0A562IYU4_9GAMM|nr:nitrogen fixation protein NifZ [Azomonas agilis]TWH76179.1 nitrogen fixation protein NifZ [Azomonas agilis]